MDTDGITNGKLVIVNGLSSNHPTTLCQGSQNSNWHSNAGPQYKVKVFWENSFGARPVIIKLMAMDPIVHLHAFEQ